MAHVCPWWLGYFLASPIRRLSQNPEKILRPYLAGGMTVLEIGPGMGFFSIPAARMVGHSGKIICVDVQEKMLKVLFKKAVKARCEDIIETRLCSSASLGIDDLADKIDFALAFAVIHEVPDEDELIRQIYPSLKQGGKLLISEPKGHVGKNRFEESIARARNAGFRLIGRPEISRSRSSLFQK